MKVLRSLERVHSLVYGENLPNKRRVRRLGGFDFTTHLSNCHDSRDPTNEKMWCQTARDFVGQDYNAQREKLR